MIDTIKNDVVKWLNDNRKLLPLNVKSWKIDVISPTDQLTHPKPLVFGKYNSTSAATEGFYKAISRSININEDE